MLASGSPRRRELLALFGLPYRIEVPGVDETPRLGEDPVAYVRRLAEAKAEAVERRRPEIVIAADTTVVLDGEILGKPTSDDHAAQLLRRLAGRTHQVMTGVVVAGRRLRTEVVTTAVRFAPMTEEDVTWYVATGEPAGKAGAYAIQGAGGMFVEAVEGSVSNVVGLPLHTVRAMLAGEGVRPG